MNEEYTKHDELSDKMNIALGYLCGISIRYNDLKSKNIIGDVEHLAEAIQYLRDVKAAFFPEPVKPPCKIIRIK